MTYGNGGLTELLSAGSGGGGYHSPMAKLRGALLCSVGGFALATALATTAQAGPGACTLSGSIATCQGDQSDGVASGIDFAPSFTVLNVNSLSADIEPGVNIDGIVFHGDTTATINSNLGNRIIDISGFAQGIKATAPGDVVINHSGRIEDAEIGVEGYSTGGDVTIDNKGRIDQAQNRGISAVADAGMAKVTNNADVDGRNVGIFALGETGATIDSTGKINSVLGRGLDAQSNSGAANITNVGNVNSYIESIHALSNSGTGITIKSTGDLRSTLSRGIVASMFGADPGQISIETDGEISSRDDGINAYNGSSNGTGVDITSKGNITSLQGDAISVWSFTGDVEINSTGNLEGFRGIMSYLANSPGGSNNIYSTGDIESRGGGLQTYVFGEGATTRIEQAGDVTALQTKGIFAQAQGGTMVDQNSATIISRGDVTAATEAIGAFTSYGTVTIDHRGDVRSWESKGIEGFNISGGDVYITSVGDIDAKTSGIYASSAGGIDNATTMVNSTGDIMSIDSFGINAIGRSTGADIDIISKGDVFAKTIGIQAIGQSGSNQTATVHSTGDVTATDDFGILALASSDFGVAEITSHGKIMSGTNGLFAFGDTFAGVYQVGDVTALYGNGIQVQALGDSDDKSSVEVDFKGEINARQIGIMAFSNGSATINSQGDINAFDNDGINVYAGNSTDNGDVVINSTGDITAGGRGIIGVSLGDGVDDTLEITSVGRIMSKTDGILAIASGSTAIVKQTGDITSIEGRGMQVHAQRDSTLTSEGHVQAQDEGIDVLSATGTARLDHTGDVSSTESRGVVVQGQNGSAFSTTNGRIQAQDHGILAIANNGMASVNHTGDVISTDSRGIEAYNSGAGSAEVTLNGNAQGLVQGIQALSLGSGAKIDVTGSAYTTTGNAMHAQAASGLVKVDLIGDSTSLEGGAIFAESTAGSVEVTVDKGLVRATGGANQEADGIFVNAGTTGSVMVMKDAVVYGGFDVLENFGVQFGGSGTNNLTNYGEINDKMGGQSVGGADGDETVDNYGIVTGSFFLGGGTNTFNNMNGGWLNMGFFSSVGVGNDLINSGNLSPLGIGTIGESDLEGNFVQTATGNFFADIDFGNGDADLLDVQPGDTATVDGFVSAYITNIGTTVTPQTATIINSPAGVTDNGIVGADQGAIMTTVTTDADSVDIEVGVDFGAGGGLGSGVQSLGNAIQDAFETDVPGGLTPEEEAFYLALLNSGDTSAYTNSLYGTSPIGQGAIVGSTLNSMQNFTNALFSCRVRDGEYRFTAEGNCVWGRVQGWTQDYDPSGSAMDYDTNAVSIAGGIQNAINETWVVGLAGGYESGDTDSFNTKLDHERFDLGVVAKGQYGAWQIAGALSGGFGDIDSKRSVTIPAPATAKGNRDTQHFDAAARGSYIIESGNTYVKGILEGGATYVSADGFTEKGAGAANMKVSDMSDWYGRGVAMVEVGGEYAGGNGVLFRPYLSAGVTALTNNDVDISASIPGLGIGSFTVSSEVDSVYGDVRVGADVLNPNGFNLRIEYAGQFSENSAAHSGLLKGSLAF